MTKILRNKRIGNVNHILLDKGSSHRNERKGFSFPTDYEWTENGLKIGREWDSESTLRSENFTRRRGFFREVMVVVRYEKFNWLFFGKI